MSVQISNEKAYQDYLDLNLFKRGVKSANFENVSAILKHNNVEINLKPSDLVSFSSILSTFFNRTSTFTSCRVENRSGVYSKSKLGKFRECK